jgi:hypothetical protein
MNESLLGLQKKDDNLQIIEQSDSGFVVMTSLVDPVEPIPPDPPMESVPPSVNIQIARHYFAAHAFILFFIPLFGIVPFYLLVELPFIVSTTLTCCSFVFGIIIRAVIYHIYDSWALMPTFLLMVFNNFIFIVSLSAFASSFAPLQGCTILFVECVAVILMGFLFKKKIDPIWSALVMMLSGLIVWSVGLYAFIREQDWISSGLLFITCVVTWPLFSGWKIYQINDNTFHTGEILQLLCSNPFKFK